MNRGKNKNEINQIIYELPYKFYQMCHCYIWFLWNLFIFLFLVFGLEKWCFWWCCCCGCFFFGSRGWLQLVHGSRRKHCRAWYLHLDIGVWKLNHNIQLFFSKNTQLHTSTRSTFSRRFLFLFCFIKKFMYFLLL